MITTLAIGQCENNNYGTTFGFLKDGIIDYQ
jgi:hypothetical protein